MQAERRATAEKLQKAEQQLGDTREEHERYVITQEANARAQEAAALQQRTEELSGQKDTLDRCNLNVQCQRRHRDGSASYMKIKFIKCERNNRNWDKKSI